MANFKTQAAGKRQAIFDAIPKKWIIPTAIPPAAEQRDVTGSYIQQFLTPREIEITETDAVGIAEHTTTGKWTAVEVTEAFCHRAALAHQLVSIAIKKNIHNLRIRPGYMSTRDILRRSP